MNVIVLLGPPGAGKTLLGSRLRDTLGYQFSETERDLLKKYGSREAFLADKAAALASVEETLRERAASGSRPLVIESTGLSDRPMLERLARDFTVAFIQVDVPREVCVARVRDREPGRNFSNHPDHAATLYDHWAESSRPHFEYALEVDHLDGRTDTIVEQIAALVGPIDRD